MGALAEAMTRQRRSVTVGIDIGTTSVKALAVDDDGCVLGRSRVSHRLLHPSPDFVEHDAKRAWLRGPLRALGEVVDSACSIAGICVAGMVPSLTAVDLRGIPLGPGILYGDARGMLGGLEELSDALGGRTAEGMLRWLKEAVPRACGFWPAQAVALNGIAGVGAVDGSVAVSMGSLLSRGKWDEELLESIGVGVESLPEVVDMGAPVGRVSEGRLGYKAVVAGGTVDALCDQIVSGALESGDVLVVFGATLVVWAVVDQWMEVDGLWTVPHTVEGKVLIGGPSNAGGLFVDWARAMLRKSGRVVDPELVPVWLPYLRGERVPFHDPGRRSSLSGLHISHGPNAAMRAAYEASGFVIRNLLERSGIRAKRIVASGGGTRDEKWMQAVADTTGIPVELVQVPEGAALGAAFVARVAAGLEESVVAAVRWAKVRERIEPDERWTEAVSRRYETFCRASEAAQ
jgi:xylulokinase